VCSIQRSQPFIRTSHDTPFPVVRVATRIGFPITLEVTKEAVRRIRRTLSRDEGEDLILKAYMSEDFRDAWTLSSTSGRRTSRASERPGEGRGNARPRGLRFG
jgi:hypothetical protein